MNNSNLNPADLKVIFLKKIIAIKLDIMILMQLVMKIKYLYIIYNI